MKYTKKQFLVDVAKEARALKKIATKKEIERLDAATLSPTSSTQCVYGQMTGNCVSERSIKLISYCCKRFIDLSYVDAIEQQGFMAIREHINGAKMPATRILANMGWLSSIESYISLPNAKNKNLIAYLKDERKDLVL